MEGGHYRTKTHLFELWELWTIDVLGFILPPHIVLYRLSCIPVDLQSFCQGLFLVALLLSSSLSMFFLLLLLLSGDDELSFVSFVLLALLLSLRLDFLLLALLLGQCLSFSLLRSG